MENPIILLIFWALINLLIGNAKNKKRAAQRKAKQVSDPFPPDEGRKVKSKPKGKDFRETLDEYRKQLEKEFGGQAANKNTEKPVQQKLSPPKQRAVEPHKELIPAEVTAVSAEILEDGLQTQYTASTIQLKPKEDIVKAIIYAEILGKPKALANKFK